MSSIDLTVDRKGVKGVGNLGPEALRELIRSVERIGDRVEDEARIRAPQGETGQLKEHPVDRGDTHIGNVTRFSSFGGGQSVRGAGGRFVSGGTKGELGNAVVLIDLTVAEDPFYAEFVHGGTGLYGKYHHVIVPRTKKFMVFTWKGKKHRRKTVRGQAPQPYLTEAFAVVERTFVPLEVERLRARIEVLALL